MKRLTPLLLDRPLFTRLLRLTRWVALLPRRTARAHLGASGASFTFSNTGALNQARIFPSATLLSNGEVLVAGGQNSAGDSLASAELYDPATGAWTGTRGMTAARTYATATLLPERTVLVVGGSNTNGTLSSAEVYNPTSGDWTAVSGLTDGRFLHTATLANGKVLVAGGNRL